MALDSTYLNMKLENTGFLIYDAAKIVVQATRPTSAFTHHSVMEVLQFSTIERPFAVQSSATSVSVVCAGHQDVKIFAIFFFTVEWLYRKGTDLSSTYTGI